MKIVCIGAGSHLHSLRASLSKDDEIVAYFDNLTTEVDGTPITGRLDELEKLLKMEYDGAIISLGDLKLRKQIIADLKRLNIPLLSIIDETALTCNNHIGAGTFIGKRAIINANATIKEHCIINTASVIEHDCQIGANCHIAPCATLCGGVIVEDDVMIGANATIIQNIKIGTGATIGAGATIIKDVRPHTTVVGTPGKEI